MPVTPLGTVGVNLSGAEFGGSGMRYGYDYIYPSAADLSFYTDRSITLVRLPFKWERMQRELEGPLDAAELNRLKTFLTAAEEQGVQVILDLHNFGRYHGKPIGSEEVPIAAFADFWARLSAALEDHPATIAYDLMNEPHDMGDRSIWPAAAQAAVDAIRAVDMSRAIYVQGDGWSGAANWAKYNADLNIVDPADNLYYEAHVYFDANNAGTYKGSYDAEHATPETGVKRLKPFLDWLAAHDAKGFIGEFSVPDNDPRWLTVLDEFLDAMVSAGLSGTYWGAGPWWGSYPMALRGPDGLENPQMDIVERYVAPSDGLDMQGASFDVQAIIADALMAPESLDIGFGGFVSDAFGGDTANDFPFMDGLNETGLPPAVILV